jgi:spore germination protein KA
MIPTPLAINLLAQREGVPFPVFFEAFLMEIAFELMREAGTRMPRAIGQAVSTVGAIVLGQAAVEAGIVTAMMVIIVSFTGIASFTLPGFTLSTSARLIRFPMMIAASTFGFYGVFLGIILLVAHLTSLRSFGIPYLSPFAPFGFKHQKDTLWRSPHKTPNTRPELPDARRKN